MREDRIYGAALIAGAIAVLGTGVLHPTGSQMSTAEGFARYAPINVLAHSLALAGVWLTFTGVVGLARRLGPQRPDVTAASIAFALGAAMVSVAAIVDGLVATGVAGQYVATDVETQRAALIGFMKFCYDIASSLSRYYVTAVAVAVLLWSWAAWRTRFDRVLPWLGAGISAVALLAQLSGHMRMNVHDVMLLALGQGLWMTWAGVVLWRRPA